ncbi:MAG: phenylalanine--tRNA ligase subunit alpha, partial [Thermoplasmata archaeon]
KRKGWVDIDKSGGSTTLVLTDRGRDMLKKQGRDEKVLSLLTKGEVSEDDVDKDAIDMLLSRRDLVCVRERVVRTITLTDLGIEAVKRGIEVKEEVTQLTPELIKSGLWREVSFRRYDVERFVPKTYGGKEHPLTTIMDDVREVFIEMGFEEICGNYVESAFWNMDVLFIPQDHPARDMQDTFYVDSLLMDIDEEIARVVAEIHENGWKTGSRGWGYKWSADEARKAILRTHTTVNTIRYLSKNNEPPIRVFSIERVFRRENLDPTHLPEFHQIEGILMEEDANFSMLMGVLKEFYQRMGFPNIRFRPSYFPYTEPSLEVEVNYGGKWLELGGAGIFRPEVTEQFGIKYPVLAWGLGLERLAMLKLGIHDLRQLYISDIDWLRNVPLILR